MLSELKQVYAYRVV